jgi:hypothetical protein
MSNQKKILKMATVKIKPLADRVLIEPTAFLTLQKKNPRKAPLLQSGLEQKMKRWK